jgi:hypothetical protein
LGASDPVKVVAASLTSFDLPWADAESFMHANREGGDNITLMSPSSPEGPVSVIGGLFSRQNLVLSVGGVASDAVINTANSLVNVARRLASSCSYAFVSFGVALGSVLQGVPDHNDNISQYYDELIHDAYPYQILSKGHLMRLGHMPAGAQALDQGRFELRMGDFSDWLLGDDEGLRLREAGRVALAACLANNHIAVELHRERWTIPPGGTWTPWRGFSNSGRA